MTRSKTRRYKKRKSFRKRGTKRRNIKKQYGGRDPTPRVTSNNPNDLNEEEAILERQMRIII